MQTVPYEDLFGYLLYILGTKEDEGALKLEQEYWLSFKRNKYESIIRDKRILDLYKSNSDGFKVQWYTDDSRSVGGQMHFPKMDHVLGTWEGILFDQEAVERNQMLGHFKAMDLISEQHSVGLLHNADFEANSLYYHISPYEDLYSLDLDFKGYIQMAFEAKLYYYWPKVLLDIQSKSESKETKDFREQMPKIFEDFSWDAFVEKYESLRLSKQ